MKKTIIVLLLISSLFSIAQLKGSNLESKFLVIDELIKLGSFDSAESDLKEILKVDSLNGQALFKLGELYEIAAAKNNSLKFADKIVFEFSYKYYEKASKTNEYRDKATERINNFKTVLFTGDDYFGKLKKETISLADNDYYYWVDEIFNYDQEYFRARALELGIK